MTEPTPIARVVTGGCRCGRVRFRGRTTGLKAVASGCRACQRSSGTFVSVAVGLAARTFEVTDGHADLASYADVGDSEQPVHRFFCRVCGLPLFARPESYEHVVSVRTVALDEPFTDAPVFAIYDENIPTWLHLADVQCMDADEATEAAEDR